MFAVTITVMVLELRPPERATFAALLPLWPTVLSYVVSYQFIAIVWVNHHHLLRFIEDPPPRVMWINFAHLFMVSLVPFSTAWVARTRLAAVPVFVYSAVFVLVELAYLSSSTMPWLKRPRAKLRSGAAVSPGSDHCQPLFSL